MDVNRIKNIMKNLSPKPMDIDNDTSFSVLLPLIEINNETHLIYEVRSKLIRQPGEISFPGGRIEKGESPICAAIRETQEELGIEESNIEIITELDYAASKSDSFVYTFLGHIKDTDTIKLNYNKDEVSELFYVPLSYFMDTEPEVHFVNYYPKFDSDFPYHMVNDGENYNWESIKRPLYFYKYKNYIIWGLTAKITYNFIRKINGYR